MLIPSTCAERAIRNVGERAFLRTRSLLGFASGRLKDVMRSAPSMQAPGALIAYSRMAQSLPHSAVVHAARESIRTAATLTQRSRRYTQRFSVLSGAKRSGHGKRANIERRQDLRPECNGGRVKVHERWRIFTGRAGDIRSGFPF